MDLGEPTEIWILLLSACQTYILSFLPLFRCSSWSWHRWSTEMQIWQRWQPWGHVRGNLWRLPAQGPTRYLHMSIQSPLFSFPVYCLNTSFCADVQEMFTCVQNQSHLNSLFKQSIWSFLYFCLYLDKLFWFLLSACVSLPVWQYEITH